MRTIETNQQTNNNKKRVDVHDAFNACVAHACARLTEPLPAFFAALLGLTLTMRSASRSDAQLHRGLPRNRISCADTETHQLCSRKLTAEIALQLRLNAAA